MTIDANLICGIQIGWVIGMISGSVVTILIGRLVWREKLKLWREMKRGGYAGVQQE